MYYSPWKICSPAVCSEAARTPAQAGSTPMAHPPVHTLAGTLVL